MLSKTELKYPNYQVCGIDEAGRGPLAGPLSLALVHFSKEILQDVWASRSLKGLKDSKKLSETQRVILYKELLSLPILVRHVFMHSELIDEKGINYCIQQGILVLLKNLKLENPFLLIDGNYNFFPKDFYPYQSIIKGDEKVASISAASIIAKVKRDRFMKKMDCFYPQFQFSIHKGYGTKLHMELISKYGITRLHRKSFLKKFYESQSQLYFEL